MPNSRDWWHHRYLFYIHDHLGCGKAEHLPWQHLLLDKQWIQQIYCSPSAVWWAIELKEFTVTDIQCLDNMELQYELRGVLGDILDTKLLDLVSWLQTTETSKWILKEVWVKCSKMFLNKIAVYRIMFSKRCK